MEQRLPIYRQHTPACIHGYKTPIQDGDFSVVDCTCPLNASGWLRNEINADGTPKRIRHRSLNTKSWAEARATVAQWLEWGQTTKPASIDDDLSKLENVTVRQAVEFFFQFGEKTNTKGDSALDKYQVLLNKRLMPWAESRRKTFIRDFDNAVTVKQFFISWTNLQPTRNKTMAVVPKKDLAGTTTRAELERLRTFLEFCRNNGWIKKNYAKAPFIKLGRIKVQQKFAWTDDEYERILATLDNWQDRYIHTNARAERLRAFCLTLRYTGQRISDVAMLGPESVVEESGHFFLSLTQIKEGVYVKIPVPPELVARLRALPIIGRTSAPFRLERNNYTIQYGSRFWFWRADVPENANTKQINQIIESAAKNWSDDVTAVIKKTEKTYGPFQYHATPHTFRHYFAITMLSAGVTIEIVSKWLGHSSTAVTARHYWHANADWNDISHQQYMKALGKINDKPRKVVAMRKTA